MNNSRFGFDRLKNNIVIDRFLNFDTGSNHNRSLRILEDTLMSYDTIISRRHEDGFKVLYPSYAPTITTKKHINKLLRKAAEIDETIILAIEI